MTKRNYPSDGQGVLPDTEVKRHPMWTKTQECGVPWVDELHREIAKRLRPFDGRPNSEVILDYCAEVYRASIRALTDDIFGKGKPDAHHVVGFIAIESARLGKLCVHRGGPRRRQVRDVLWRLAQQFTEAIERSL